MLRIIQNSVAAGAKSYYSTADYYAEGQELTGVWRGVGAERLGLSGEVKRDQWDLLCDNRHPQTGDVLTVRQRADRRVGYDFNFHVPKSVSILYGITQDERLLDAFREAVGSTMRDVESEMQTRVRVAGKNEDRTTGNMAWGEFVHFTARPVDGVPDPHLHAHCFVFNTTFDAAEDRWKAGQFAALKRDAPYFEAVFHSRLARAVEELGLPVQRTRQGWEIAGMPPSAIRRFSRRTSQIEDKAAEQGITHPALKGELGAKTRDRKRKDLSLAELRELWKSRLSDTEGAALRSLVESIGAPAIVERDTDAREAVEQATLYCFERSSVVPERTLVTVALKRGYGAASETSLKRELAAAPLLRAARDGKTCVTTGEVLGEERRLVEFARAGRGGCRRLGAGDHAFKREWLNDGQRGAVRHVLESHDRVMVIRGAAGTGKTSMMQEAVEGIEAGGHQVFAFAPSADASRGVLRSEGFATADTVARLLLDERLHEQVKGQVIWIDEAGLLSTRVTAQLFDLAGRLDARVILSGDRKQHGSVERGAALRLLEEEAGIVPAQIKEIQRQKGDYKEAVRALSEGRANDGFHQLDKLGWVREVGDDERYKVLADDYVAAIDAGKTALVVSPTHREGDRVTDAIRAALRTSGRIAAGDRIINTLENANLTEAERGDAVNLTAGDVLVFHQNAKGITRGGRLAVGSDPLPLTDADKYQVFHTARLAVAPGDVLRITRNGTTADGAHRLNNGALYTLKGFDANGNLVLANGWTIGRDFCHLSYGYCVTSHASQGKTVDRVLIGQSSESFPASSREQFYVSASRGRESAVVYTDDKRALMQAVDATDARVTATDLLRGRDAILEPVRVRTASITRRGPHRGPEPEKLHG